MTYNLKLCILAGGWPFVKLPSPKGASPTRMFINKRLRLGFSSRTPSDPFVAMHYLRAVCIALEMIIAGVIRWNIATKHPLI